MDEGLKPRTSEKKRPGTRPAILFRDFLGVLGVLAAILMVQDF
jgi:hypothetical protein